MNTTNKVKTKKSKSSSKKPNELVIKRPSWAEAKPGPAFDENSSKSRNSSIDSGREEDDQPKDITAKFIKAAKRFVIETAPNHRVRKHSRAFKREYSDMDQRLSLLMDTRLSIGGSSLTPEQVQEYEDAFNSFDINGDGDLSRDELSQLLKKIGVKHTGSRYWAWF